MKKNYNLEIYKLNLVDNKIFNSIDEFQFIKDPIKNRIQLGMGSFGEVKLAINKKTQEKYAIKIMNLKNMHSLQEIQGIEREIRVHSQLNHPNIIQYYDSFQENELVFIVLDYAQNGNLYSYLQKKKHFSEKEAFKFFYQTCQALKYLHEMNIVHRDIKPENILIDENLQVKLCDFGWCTEDMENPRNTFCGTYEYMAPEIVFRQQYDYRIDIWALGVLIYEFLHGSAPFKGKSLKEIQLKIQKGDVLFSTQITDLSKSLICKLLQANPLKRISIDDILQHPWMQKMKEGHEIQSNKKNSDRLICDQPKIKQQTIIVQKPNNNNISQSPLTLQKKQQKSIQLQQEIIKNDNFQVNLKSENKSQCCSQSNIKNFQDQKENILTAQKKKLLQNQRIHKICQLMMKIMTTLKTNRCIKNKKLIFLYKQKKQKIYNKTIWIINIKKIFYQKKMKIKVHFIQKKKLRIKFVL
ncbi:protein kinase domain protein [Ichthyophthirius multifiliis]|uniref:Aurora kinase n=1 Tax=Ichthyophthirius multifiliis TaxID=5932 RepID=G0R2T0_ICHMU|nr:protein kinase domain protein [Ichthyophthirius multifiliis]EGR28202.1 protein kinase domain protein [Ichthyophthirius multifiliis]|eukprot:XP_004027547.1 protein kinase domain protein [Ichthyophthirius multifiliis]